MPADAADWLRHARRDLAAARSLARDEELPARTACFWAQQVAKKTIKAILVEAEVPFRKVHDLAVLAGLALLSVGEELENLEIVSLHPWAVAGRYPGDAAEAANDDARSALTIASATIAVANRHLGSNG